MRQRLPSFFLMKKTGEATGDLDRHICWPPVKHKTLEVLNAFSMMGQNLQMVLAASQMASHPGSQGLSHHPTDQKKFTASFLEIQGNGQEKEESSSVTSFTALEAINEENEELGSLSGKEN